MLGAVLIAAFTARLVWAVRGPATDSPLDAPSRVEDEHHGDRAVR